MALRDYRWQITGEVSITDLNLKDPVIRVVRVNYDAAAQSAMVYVKLKEGQGIYEHVRDFTHALPDPENDEGLSADNIAAFIKAVFPTAVEIVSGAKSK